MSISKYILLFHKRATTKLNEEEQSDLNNWLQDKENAQFEKQLDKTWALSARYKSDYEPDLGKALERFQHSLADANTTAIEENAKVVSLPRRFLAIAASLALLFAMGWWMFSSSSGTQSIQMNAFSTKQEEVKTIDLPDGTQVVLNENSEFFYPNSFEGQSTRVVSVSGEAYFKVYPDPKHPFIIETPDTKVTVLGTAFNLRAYPEEDFTEVEVEEGKVAFEGAKSAKALTLQALDKGICRSNGSMNKQIKSTLNAHSWRTQTLNFRDTDIEQVIQDIERHYKVRIDLVKSDDNSCTFSGIYGNDKLEDLLEVFRLTFNATIIKKSVDQLEIIIPSCQ